MIPPIPQNHKRPINLLTKNDPEKIMGKGKARKGEQHIRCAANTLAKSRTAADNKANMAFAPEKKGIELLRKTFAGVTLPVHIAGNDETARGYGRNDALPLLFDGGGVVVAIPVRQLDELDCGKPPDPFQIVLRKSAVFVLLQLPHGDKCNHESIITQRKETVKNNPEDTRNGENGENGENGALLFVKRAYTV